MKVFQLAQSKQCLHGNIDVGDTNWWQNSGHNIRNRSEISVGANGRLLSAVNVAGKFEMLATVIVILLPISWEILSPRSFLQIDRKFLQKLYYLILLHVNQPDLSLPRESHLSSAKIKILLKNSFLRKNDITGLYK